MTRFYRYLSMGFKRMFHTVLWISLTAMAVLPFQNCSQIGHGSRQPASDKTGGEGFDGKPYNSNGKCGKDIQVSDTIMVAHNFQRASIVRENCEDLSTPRPLPIEQVKFNRENLSVLSYGGKVYDEVRDNPAVQPTTMFMCESSGANPSVQSLIWKQGSGLFGSLSLSNGMTSGGLSVLEPSAATPYRYVTADGQSSQFDFLLGGSLSYSLNNGATNGFAPSLNCSSQPPPIRIVNRTSVMMSNVDATTRRGNFKTTGAGNTIVVGLSIYETSASTCRASVTDNVGNTYVSANVYAWAANSGSSDIWYASNSIAGANRITVTVQPGCTGGIAAYIAEVSGLAQNDPVDTTAVLNSQPSTAAPGGAAVTTTQQRSFVFSVLVHRNSVTNLQAGSIFDPMEVESGDAAAAYVADAPGTYRADWLADVAGTYSSSTVVFKPAW